MQIIFKSIEEFNDKAGILAEALNMDMLDGRSLMAQIAGYDSSVKVQTGTVNIRHAFSREELMARLQSECPNVDNERAARIIDSLALPTRDTRLEDIPESPDAAPNMGG